MATPISMDSLSTQDHLQFLLQLHKNTGSDLSEQASMYDVGLEIGLDRDAAGLMAEECIGRGLVEIRTLSGGIGITAQGIVAAERAQGSSTDAGASPTLTRQPVLDEADCETLWLFLTDVKQQISDLGLDYTVLAEVVMDLRTLELQLSSSRPKTAIIRACLKAVCDGLEGAGAVAAAAPIRRFLSDPN